MSVPLTTLRATLASALSNPDVWDTHSYPQATPTSNSVTITPADPYVTPNNNTQASIACMANFKIILMVSMYDNQGALVKIEDYLVAVFNKLSASNISMNVSAVSAPSVLSVASGDYLSTDITINTLTTWS